jgi:hypothetical protein
MIVNKFFRFISIFSFYQQIINKIKEETSSKGGFDSFFNLKISIKYLYLGSISFTNKIRIAKLINEIKTNKIFLFIKNQQLLGPLTIN